MRQVKYGTKQRAGSTLRKVPGNYKELTLMSDMFMWNVFKQKECLEYVLQVIMEKQELQVIDQVIQKDYKNLQGRSAILDCVAKDEEAASLTWKYSRITKELCASFILVKREKECYNQHQHACFRRQ